MPRSIETVAFEAEQKKSLRELLPQLNQTGFDKIQYRPGRLVLEKFVSQPGAADAPETLAYRIILGKKFIELHFPADDEPSRRKNLLTILPVFIHVLLLAEDYYTLRATPLFPLFLDLLEDLSRYLGTEALDLSSELDETRKKHTDLLQKYEELVRSSEENARILLECERRRDELIQRVGQLEGMSDEMLRQTLFEWVRVHGGTLVVAEFAKTYHLPLMRVEEGLRMLMQDGYIKRRSE